MTKLSKKKIFIHFTFTLISVEISVIESCENTFNSTNQEVKYPPSNISSEVQNNCSWRINVPTDRVVVLTLNEIHIHASSNCEQSSLEVFDGFDAHSTRLGEKMCGILATKNFESTGSEIFLTYTSTSLNFTDRFIIEYKVSGNL